MIALAERLSLRWFSDGCCKAVSAGLIGVVVPLYLAECLNASSRGKGTAFSSGC